jgi:hypothetical protein
MPLVAAIAAGAVLLILHRLRVSPPRRIVATTLFWKQAVREEHRRVLWERLSRWKSFALLLSILLLLALVLSGIRWPAKESAGAVAMVIDCAGSMNVKGADGRSRLDLAIDRARADLANADGNVSVITAGAMPQLLNNKNDPPAVTDAALKTLKPEEGLSASRDALQMALALAGESGKVRWYTDHNVVPVEFPEPLRARVEIQPVGQTAANAGIKSAVYKPAGAFALTGDLHVRIGSWGVEGTPVSVQLSIASRSPLSASVQGDEAVFRDVPASGEDATISLLPADAYPADSTVKLTLPRRPAIAFEYGASVPAPLRVVTELIAQSAKGNSAVAIHVADSGDTLPRIQVVRGLSTVSSGTPIESSDERYHFDDAVCAAGVDLRDVAPRAKVLISAGNWVLAASDGQRLLLSDALFADGSNCAQRPAFLAILQDACRSLAGWTDVPQSLSLQRLQDDPLWRRGASSAVVASDFTSDLRVDQSPVVPASSTSSVHLRFELWQVILAIAIALLLLEMLLHLKGKVV